MGNPQELENLKNQPENEEDFKEKVARMIAPLKSNDLAEEQLKSAPKAYFRKYEGLTYEEAAQYLNERTPVRLPEWNGIWFPINGKVFVFTKDNEILDTPDVDTYGVRNDWTCHIGDIPDLGVRFVKALRLRADSLLTHINSGEAGRNREVSLAATSVQLGFMWLGIELGALGSANPYPKSMDKSSPIIEKHADKAQDDFYGYISSPDLDETAKVKALRSEVQLLINMVEFGGNFNRTGKNAWGVACDKFIEAKLWLGQQLNNIRLIEEEKQRNIVFRKVRLLEEAQKAYTRYGAVTDFKNFQGNPMPGFKDLPEKIQEAWCAAVDQNKTGEMGVSPNVSAGTI